MVKWIVIMKIQPSICLDDWKTTKKKTPSQVGRHQDLNPGPLECESRALPWSHLSRDNKQNARCSVDIFSAKILKYI